MKVFFSWSRPLSRALVNILVPWFKVVHHRLDPVSSFDLPPGSPWFGETSDLLAKSDSGVLIITQENLESPWLLFEAGALANGPDAPARVVPLLFGMTTKEFENYRPLAEFQAIEFSAEGMLRLLKDLNDRLGEDRIDSTTLKTSFDRHWESLVTEVSDTLQRYQSEAPARYKRSRRALLENFSELFSDYEISLIAGVYDGMNATLAAELGFGALWLSSLCLSSALGVADNETMPITEVCNAASRIHSVTDLPLIIDAETGLSPRAPLPDTIEAYYDAGVTGLCFEDAVYPKVNVLEDTKHRVRPRSSFVAHIEEILNLASPLGVGVIARTNALAAGESVEQVLCRVRYYSETGVAGVIVHDNSRDPTNLLKILNSAGGEIALGCIPTTFPDVSAQQLKENGARFVIYANQSCRASIAAVRETYRKIIEDGCTADLEARLEPLSILTELYGQQ